MANTALGKRAPVVERKSGVIAAKSMSIKTLSAGMAVLVTLLGAASDVALAQRPQSTQASQGASAQQGTPAKGAPTPQRGPDRKPWWIDEATKKEIGLTVEQVKKIDDIWTAAKDELFVYVDARERECKELDRMIGESKAERYIVTRQIDKCESQRSNYSKLRTITLYQMHLVLTPEQRVKLQAIELAARNRRDPRKHP